MATSSRIFEVNSKNLKEINEYLKGISPVLKTEFSTNEKDKKLYFLVYGLRREENENRG